MMKLKALRNIGGVVTAHAGQEFEVTNEAQARDLIQQGVAHPVSTDGQEVQALFNNQDPEKMAFEYEKLAVERAECEMAYSEAVQKEVNKLEDQRLEAMEQVKQQAKSQAEQKIQAYMQQQGANQQSTESSQFKGENQLNDQRF
jgi:D-alanyl-D-alanine carboxypeptidase